jgi:hypothetical protein
VPSAEPLPLADPCLWRSRCPGGPVPTARPLPRRSRRALGGAVAPGGPVPPAQPCPWRSRAPGRAVPLRSPALAEPFPLRAVPWRSRALGGAVPLAERALAEQCPRGALPFAEARSRGGVGPAEGDPAEHARAEPAPTSEASFTATASPKAAYLRPSMYFGRWRTSLLVISALVLLALLLTALFWLGLLLAALALVAWFNIFLLPRVAFRSRIPELLLAAALLPIAAAIGLWLAGTGGLVAGCTVWVLGVASPRVVMWRLRRRFSRSLATDPRGTRIIDTRYTSRNPW